MMLDIFSSFDPCIHSSASFFGFFFWLLLLIPIFMFFSHMWVFPPSFTLLPNLFISVMFEQISRTSSKLISSTSSFISPIFILILIINFSGLIPYVFSFSSHLSFTLMLGLPMWMSLIISGVSKDYYSFSASLLPGGAPTWMNPALVIIETTSIIVRPLTLSFRLAANMSAGHIVLGLVGIYSAVAIISSSSISLLFLQMSYMLFEVGIAIIQSYIFCLLLTLYSDDHPH